MPELTAADRELQGLAADLRKLEAEYTMYFAGRIPRPPFESRAKVEQTLKRYERAPFGTQAHRFQFAALQARFSTFADLWDRNVRAREEGRPTAMFRLPPSAPAKPRADASVVVHATAFFDPVQELDKLRDLYDALMDARRETGSESVPFHRFADLVKRQVAELQERYHSPDVSFRVVVEDGRVRFKARPGGADADAGSGESSD